MSDSGAPATVSVCSMINCTVGKCAMEPITSRLAATIQHTSSSTSARRRRQNRTNLHFREPSTGRGGICSWLCLAAFSPEYLLSGFEARKTLGRRVSLRCNALDKRSWWSWRCSPPHNGCSSAQSTTAWSLHASQLQQCDPHKAHLALEPVVANPWRE